MKSLVALPLVAVLLLAGCAADNGGSDALANCVTRLVARLGNDVPNVSAKDLDKFTERAQKVCAADQKKDPKGFAETWGD